MHAIHDSQQQGSSIGFLFLKLPPRPSAELLVEILYRGLARTPLKEILYGDIAYIDLLGSCQEAPYRDLVKTYRDLVQRSCRDTAYRIYRDLLQKHCIEVCCRDLAKRSLT